MNIADLLRQKGHQVYSVDEGATVLKAVQSLNAHRIGALVVTGAQATVGGIVSERDVMRHLNDTGGGLGTTKVVDIMTPESKMVVATPDDDLDYAMAVMTSNRIRHLPVVLDGKLCGMISIGDVIKNQLSSTAHENKMLADYIAGTYPG